jgi:hypothetical protein
LREALLSFCVLAIADVSHRKIFPRLEVIEMAGAPIADNTVGMGGWLLSFINDNNYHL